MNELQRHIEILLLDNECVIVPDFGGFVTHDEPARYEQEDKLFLPPFRTLGFNPMLRMNDSLLVQSYVTAYDISYPEALRRIENEVSNLKEVLQTKGEYTLDNIGTLTVDAEGNYQFTPCEAGVLTPVLYGLDSFEFMPLKGAVRQDSKAVRQPVAPAEAGRDGGETATGSMEAEHVDEHTSSVLDNGEEQSSALIEFTDTENDSDRAIEIKLSWIRNAVAVAAAVVAFFLMSTPIANSDMENVSISQWNNGLMDKLKVQDTNMTPATPIVDADSQAMTKKQGETGTMDVALADTGSLEESTGGKQEETVKSQPEAGAAHTYCLVLASQVKRSNAEYFVQQLKNQGFDDATIYVHNNIVRVVYGNYKTEDEARKQLNLLNGNKEFAEAWIYQKKAEV